jgi:AAA domain
VGAALRDDRVKGPQHPRRVGLKDIRNSVPDVKVTLGEGGVLLEPSKLRLEPTEFIEGTPYMPRGMTSALAGDGGLGKGLLVCHWASKITERGGGVIFCSAEDDPQKTWLPRLIAAGVDLERVRMLRVQHEDVDVGGWTETIAIPNHLPLLQSAVKKLAADVNPHDVELVVIDPLDAHLSDEYDDGNSSTKRRRSLGPLEALANGLNVAVVLIHHFSKDTSQRSSHRVLGTVANRNAPRAVYLLGQNPDEELEDGAEGVERVLIHDKHNVSERAPTQLFRIEPTMVRRDDGMMISTARFAYISTIAVNAELVFGRGSSSTAEEEHDALAEARRFLLAELYDGAQPVSQVNRNADGLGISRRTLERARKLEEIESYRTGGIAGKGHWMLRLPISTTDVQEAADLEAMEEIDESLMASVIQLPLNGPQPLSPSVQGDSENAADLGVSCGHTGEWLAGDGVWRCEVCEPPAFPGEIKGTR